MTDVCVTLRTYAMRDVISIRIRGVKGKSPDTYLQVWVLGRLHPKVLENPVLQLPEFVVAPLLLCAVLVHRDVHYRACRCAGREQDGRELDQVGALAEQDLYGMHEITVSEGIVHGPQLLTAIPASAHLFRQRPCYKLPSFNAPSFPTVNVKLSCVLDMIEEGV